MGFLGFLALLFIGLKLTGFIVWPWVWVLSPVIAVLLIAFVAGLIAVFGDDGLSHSERMLRDYNRRMNKRK